MLDLIKSFVILCTVGLLSGCSTVPQKAKVADLSSDAAEMTFSRGDSVKQEQREAAEYTGLGSDEVESYYVVIADTGLNYYSLRDRMLSLHQKMKNPIDTMGRFYSVAKDLISLPDDDEDEIYRGDYFPRRFPSNTLSLEYLSSYDTVAAGKTIALVAGIYESENSADSALASVRKYMKDAYTLKADMYVGCIH